MIRTYKYRLKPTQKQDHLLSHLFSQMQTAYNDALNERRWHWTRSRRSVSYGQQWKRMREERHALPDEMGMLNATSIQQMLRRVDKAYQALYKGQRGLPRFKGKHRFKSVDYRYGDGCKLKGDRLYIQHVGDIKIRLHRPLPEGAKIKQVVVKRSVGQWTACFQIELPDSAPLPRTGPAVGIDVGLHSLLALSDGTLVDNPRWLRRQLDKLRVAQRRVARRNRGSKRRRKAAFQVAKIHETVANQRNDFWHKLTTSLVNIYPTIAVEKLNLSFMLRNGTLSLSAHDAALGRFFAMLDYKAAEAGGQVIRVNPHNTSQLCSGCGQIVAKSLSVRVHRCDCGLELDRDINAALNILHCACRAPAPMTHGGLPGAVGRTAEALTYPVADCVAFEAPLL